MDVAGVSNANKLKILPGYTSSEAHLDWFYDHSFEDWDSFKNKFIERFQKSRVKINNVLSSILGIKKKNNQSMRNSVDRFDHLVGAYNRQRRLSKDWNEISAVVLKDTFVAGIKPVAIRILVKRHLPKTLIDAQTIVIKEGQEDESEEESDSEGVISESESKEEIMTKTVKAKKSKGPKVLEKKEKAVQIDKKKNSKVGDVEKKVDDITKHLQKLTLLVEGGPMRKRNLICYNCQEDGYNAYDCNFDCKICKGAKARHVFWNFPYYHNPKDKEFYLAINSNVNNKDYCKTYEK